MDRGDFCPNDLIAWILLKLAYKELRQTVAVSRRNEVQGCGGIGFEQLGVQKGYYIVKATLSFFSKASYSYQQKLSLCLHFHIAIIPIS